MTLDNTNKTNEAAIQTYNLNTILPLQAAGATTANSIASYQLNTLLPLESDKATLDNSIATYNLNTMLPSQQLLVHEQMETAHAQTCNVRLDNNQTVTGAIGSQTTLMAVQTTVATEQAAQTTYTIANILPEQAKLIHEQMEVQHAQTCEVRLDNSETVTGLIGGQKSLYAQQVTSYQRDAEVKAVKIFTDAWITQKTMDDTTLPPTNFTNVALDEILSTIMTNNALGTPLAHV
jgi:translation initiation factor IF-1